MMEILRQEVWMHPESKQASVKSQIWMVIWEITTRRRHNMAPKQPTTDRNPVATDGNDLWLDWIWEENNYPHATSRKHGELSKAGAANREARYYEEEVLMRCGSAERERTTILGKL